MKPAPAPRSARDLRNYFARLARQAAAAHRAATGVQPPEPPAVDAGAGADADAEVTARRLTADRAAGLHDALVRAAGFLQRSADAGSGPRGGPPYAVPTPRYAVAWLAAEAREVAALRADRAAATPDAASGAYLDARELGLALVRLELLDHARRTAAVSSVARRSRRRTNAGPARSG